MEEKRRIMFYRLVLVALTILIMRDASVGDILVKDWNIRCMEFCREFLDRYT